MRILLLGACEMYEILLIFFFDFSGDSTSVQAKQFATFLRGTRETLVRSQSIQEIFLLICTCTNM